MKRDTGSACPFTFLGIECGATYSAALLVDAEGRVLNQVKAGAANLQLLNDAQLVRHFSSLKQAVGAPSSLAIGMAGARIAADRERIRQAAARVWPGVPCYATNDLETGLMAAEDLGPEVRGQRSEGEGRRAAPTAIARVLVLSGTGSCCFGRTPDGRTVRVGGWGHILGDKGSGYEIGLRGLKAAIHYLDCTGIWPPLGQRMLRALQLNDPEELVGWAQNAPKPDVAALAMEVFAAWRRRDRIATDILEGAANTLAKDAAGCARRLAKQGTPVQFVFNGSVLLKQPRFAAKVARLVRQLWPKAIITPLTRESVWGAVELARLLKAEGRRQKAEGIPPRADKANGVTGRLSSLVESPTEQRNPRSMNLDRLPLSQAIRLMLSEDAKIPAAILAESHHIKQAIQLIVRSLRQGGRLFYVGAGTSGRLGVLDASECPPTFSVSSEMVQGIMAGGQRALWESIEGAEDDPTAGAQAAQFRGVGRRDVVVGIAASGRTPFVWGALREARRRGARTVLLCFNPNQKISGANRPEVVIAPNVGPEVLTGSTRLKAGTATKLVLNLFTTLAMVRLGKVVSNLMVDVKASNAKLRDRATRIVCDLTGAGYDTARATLEQTDWRIKQACAELKRLPRT